MKCCEKWKWDVTSHHYKAERGMINCWNKTYNFCPECGKPLKQERVGQTNLGPATQFPIKPSKKIKRLKQMDDDCRPSNYDPFWEVRYCIDKINELVDAHNNKNENPL